MLDDAQKERLMHLFADGADLPTVARAAFVAQQCADDPALRHELAELLEVEASALQGFLAEPAVATPADPAAATNGPVPAAPRAQPLPEIDGYAAFERIADGGMGSVYKAMQLRPVRREVAVKLIRSGMDTDSVLARFEAERQAMALMSHPYIASVYDAGTDALGRPFLAMEFVDGAPITDYCERAQLALDDRLRLFVKVCLAVDHAHRRGVLHRDLKPSNVLVAGRGDEAMPKIIDFGIAKALAGPLGERSIHTLEGTFLGTPEYMAPEQIEGAAHAIDTRSDVYSLGVLLYELLVGVGPIDTASLRHASVVQVGRIVRDTAPPKPSTRLRALLAVGRAGTPEVGPARWLRRLEGDLDWIVMKALEKEPDRRYGSARELAADLESFLAHRTVTAGPPSGLYQLRKFARRHRVQVAAGALVLLSLVLGLSGTLWFLVESKDNERVAIARAREAEGVRIAAEAALVAPDDPNLALLLALAAGERTDDSAVRRTVYDALPQHALVRRLDGCDQGIEQGAGVLLQFLRDGRLVGAGASDAILWDPDTGAQLRRFVGPRDGIHSMVVDPGERHLLAASMDGRAYLWDIATGELLRVITGHEGPLMSCAFAPDGSSFATGSKDGTARVYSAEAAREPVVLRHGHAVSSVAFFGDGAHLVTLAGDCRTRLWNTRSGQLERTFEVRGEPEVRPETSGELFPAPRIDRIASMCNGTLRVHAGDGRLVAESTVWFPRRFGDDRLFVSYDAECRLGIVDLRSGAIEKHPELRIWSAVATLDGRHAIAIDNNLDACLLDLSAMQIVRRYLGPADKNWRPPIACHPDGRRFAVMGPDIRVWSFAPEFAPVDLRGTAPWTYLASNAAWGGAPLAVIRPDGAGLGGGRWHVFDAAAGRCLAEIDRPDLAFVAPATHGTKLIGGVPPRDVRGWTIVVFDLAGRVLREIGLPAGPPLEAGARDALDWVVDPTGRLLLTTLHPSGPVPAARAGVMLQCHDLDTGELVAEIPHPGGVPVGIGGPQSGLVAMAGWSLRTFEVVDWRTGVVRARVSRPPDGMHLSAAISPDGRYLLGTVGEPLAFVWDLERPALDLSSSPLVTYTGLTPAGGYPCGFLAGGRLCWVGCNDRVHVFETTTGRVFAVLRLRDACTGLAERPDGTELLTLTGAGRAQRWPLDPLAVAQKLAVGQLDDKELAQYRIGTPEQQRAAERAWLAANVSPGNCAKLGRMALADGDLDAAIACYQRGADLGVLGPYYEYLYRELLGLYCRRLAAARGPAARRDADRAAAMVALERARWCGSTREAVLALPGIEALRTSPRFAEVLGR